MDMTRIYLDDGTMVHHMAIIDVYDRQIVGHHESLRCRAGEWLAAWDKALLNRFPDGPRGCGLVLQVDNGCQPSSRSFRRHIALCGAKLSFTGVGVPEHNAHIERYFRSLKEEEVWPNIYDSVSEAQDAVADYIRFYNTRRVHSGLGYLTPRAFHEQHSDSACPLGPRLPDPAGLPRTAFGF